MTYIYEGPSTIATLAIAVVGGAVVLLGQELLNWWDARRDLPGAVDEAVDGVPIEPADGWTWPNGTPHADPGWTPKPADDLDRQLTRERFGKGK